jgi:hypothetical protein
MKGYSKITNLITSLIMKGERFKWTKECDQTFSKIKQCLASTLILKVPNMDRTFIV